MTFTRDLSGNNPTDLKYSPFNRTAADLTAVLALTGLYPGEIVEALNTGREYRWLGAAWGLIGPVTSVVAGTLPPPSVTINQAAGQVDPASASPILFTVVFSQDVTGFVTGDVSFTGSTVGGTLLGTVSPISPSTYTVSVSGMTTGGTVIASVPAGVATGAGGLNLTSSSTDNTVTWVTDTTPPSVTIDKAAGQADPATGTPVLFTVTFSEPVTGFVSADVATTGSTAGTLTAVVSGGPTVYTVTVTGMSVNGNVVITFGAGVASDLASNASLAPTIIDNSVAWTTGVVAPSVQTYFFEAGQY